MEKFLEDLKSGLNTVVDVHIALLPALNSIIRKEDGDMLLSNFWLEMDNKVNELEINMPNVSSSDSSPFLSKAFAINWECKQRYLQAFASIKTT